MHIVLYLSGRGDVSINLQSREIGKKGEFKRVSYLYTLKAVQLHQQQVREKEILPTEITCSPPTEQKYWRRKDFKRVSCLHSKKDNKSLEQSEEQRNG